jgi:hypothetical protein
MTEKEADKLNETFRNATKNLLEFGRLYTKILRAMSARKEFGYYYEKMQFGCAEQIAWLKRVVKLAEAEENPDWKQLSGKGW